MASTSADGTSHTQAPPDDDPATEPRDAQEKAPKSPLDFLPLQGRAMQIANWVGVLAGIWILITAVSSIGNGFSMAVGDEAKELFQFAANPFVGLMIGLLATVLTQSSSTTTAVTVGMVAGGLPIEIAIPILFGANMGTTMTSTLVSLGMARDKETFRRAFGAASVHDMYNLVSLLIFFPLEIAFGILGRASEWIASTFAGEEAGVVGAAFSGLGAVVSAITGPGADLLEWAVSPLGDVWGGITLIVLGIALILLIISFISTMLKSLLVGKAEQIFHTAIGRGPLSGIASGTLITVMVQSSSTTTSLAVPLAGSGKFSLKQIYPFTVGANIGTTLTALIAAFGFTGVEGQAALQAASVHMLYNVFAAIVVFSIPFLRPLPVTMASTLARLGSENKMYVVAWVLGMFVLLPSALIAVTVLL
ncbi:sodium-dependent phosphate cotransporter [Kineosphaera limosa]|uniref:Sodium dependent phosphate transporter n=1 Tax=Kineosphaera limosa NBRC 100340 TaxID=1184609 RepID=K6VLS7_9MICO|nr:sodium:phosphate symporter [Kineosphaera limosa]NYE02526.1 sodium-dependent phosphate cotransporter [Kineosphaera limosa]GAB97173.1 sodium dependent phosphate transporter [Kineosphaera limosa NBRC 100340]